MYFVYDLKSFKINPKHSLLSNQTVIQRLFTNRKGGMMLMLVKEGFINEYEYKKVVHPFEITCINIYIIIMFSSSEFSSKQIYPFIYVSVENLNSWKPDIAFITEYRSFRISMVKTSLAENRFIRMFLQSHLSMRMVKTSCT